MDRKNLASRAAHWSATHRKTAIWGWLVFVVVAVLVGNAVGQNEIHGADRFTGEAHRAEQTLEDAGLRPNTENVLIQDETLTIADPEFRAAVEEVAARLSRGAIRREREVPAREVAAGPRRLGVRRPAFGAGGIRDHRRRPRGTGPAGSVGGGDRVGAGRPPRAAGGAVRKRQLEQGAERHLHRGPASGRDAFAADHPADPGARLRQPGGGAGAAAARVQRRDRGDVAGRAYPASSPPWTATSHRSSC